MLTSLIAFLIASAIDTAPPAPVFAPIATSSPVPTPPRPVSVPSPTPTPQPTSTPVQPVTITIYAGVAGGAYGVFQHDDTIFIVVSINEFPDLPLPFVTGGLVENLHVRVEDSQSKTIKPDRETYGIPNSQTVSAIGVGWDKTPLSAWGYDLRKPGRYRISFVFGNITTDWALAHGYRINDEFFGDVRLVTRYADVDRHFFPPPKNWLGHDAARSSCLRLELKMLRPFPTMAYAKSQSTGSECFLVYKSKEALARGIEIERQRATHGNELRSEDDYQDCGSEHATTFMYESRTAPFTHTEAMLLKLSDGYLVARYTRPSNSPDDSSAEDALDAPCLVL